MIVFNVKTWLNEEHDNIKQETYVYVALAKEATSKADTNNNNNSSIQ